MSSVVLATAGYDHTIRFWEATSGICYRTLQYADSQVNKLEITADKTQIAAAGNPQIRIFDVNSQDTQPINTFEGHTGNVTAVGFQKDSKWMFSGANMISYYGCYDVFCPHHLLVVHNPACCPLSSHCTLLLLCRRRGWNCTCVGLESTRLPKSIRKQSSSEYSGAAPKPRRAHLRCALRRASSRLTHAPLPATILCAV